MNTIKSFIYLLCCCTMLFMVTVASSGGCNDDDGPPQPPAPVAGSFTTLVGAYFCWPGSAGSGTNAGFGIMKIQICSAVSPVFNFLATYDQNSPEIDCTSTTTDCCISADFPEKDDYTVTIHYIEQNSSTCTTGNPSTCFRWFRQESFASEFIPNCTLPGIPVNDTDPNGFIGPCS